MNDKGATMNELMNSTEVARLKAVLPNDYYYSGGRPNRRQGLYCSDEHELVMAIHGSPDAATVMACLLNQKLQEGREEGRQQVYRKLAEAIGMDVQMKELREEMAELKDKMVEMMHAAMR